MHHTLICNEQSLRIVTNYQNTFASSAEDVNELKNTRNNEKTPKLISNKCL